MSDHDISPMPPELRAAIDAERGGPSGADAARDAVRARLHATLAFAPIGGIGGSGSSGAASGGASNAAGSSGVAGAGAAMSAGKLATIVTVAVLAIGGGTAVVMQTRGENTSRESPTPTAVRPAPALVVEPEPQRSLPASLPIGARPMGNEPAQAPEVTRRSGLADARHPQLDPDNPDPVAMAPGPVADVHPTPPPAEPRSDGRPEAAILGDASRALSAGDASATLALVDAHAHAYEQGELAEERDALRIRALAALGRVSEARTFADAFHNRYPHSAHRRVVDAALDRAKESP